MLTQCLVENVLLQIALPCCPVEMNIAFSSFLDTYSSVVTLMQFSFIPRPGNRMVVN